MNYTNLFVGCSFTDPIWQSAVPWSVQLSNEFPAYIVAKAGMGIKGICTEARYYLETLPDIKTIVIILPTLWRMDFEVDEETYLCNSMVDLLIAKNNDYTIHSKAHRKWYISKGLKYDKNTEFAPVFNFLYKHQGFLVLFKEHMLALKILLDQCKEKNIKYYISAISDPLDQLNGLDYIKNDICQILETVDYKNWFKFNNLFIDKFLGHRNHPSTKEHLILSDVIKNVLTIDK